MITTKTSRRSFLGALGSLTALAWPVRRLAGSDHPQISAAQKSRNIILILSDDHRYDFMGFMGKPEFLQTPHMDRLARDGAHLRQAFVSTSLCSPSRASILTGQYAHKHGVVDNNVDIPPGTLFFPQLLQQAGYETAFFGKWHMGHDSDDPRPGFDKWVSFRGQGVYYNPELNIDGQRTQVQGYMTDILTDLATRWLTEERDPQKPFFLFLSHKAVHAMFEPAERHQGRYETKPLEYPSTMSNDEANTFRRPEWVKAQRNSWHGVDYMYHGEMDFDTFYRRYCETLLALDESIGRVRQTLEKLALDRETCVMYMGDNGFCFGEHGLIDKRQMYEESMRIPFLICCPELIEPGRVVQELVQNIDVAPTILQLAGMKKPDSMDGQSMVNLLRGKDAEKWREQVFYEYYWERNFPQTPTTFGVRSQHWKYIHYHGIWDIDELYDLQNDPEEKNNLIDLPEYESIQNELKNKMWDWLESTDGMKIPLRRDQGFRADRRRPQQ